MFTEEDGTTINNEDKKFQISKQWNLHNFLTFRALARISVLKNGSSDIWG